MWAWLYNITNRFPFTPHQLPLASTMPRHLFHFLPCLPQRITPLSTPPSTAGASAPAPAVSRPRSCHSCSWNQMPVYVISGNHGHTARVRSWNGHAPLQLCCQCQDGQGKSRQVMVTLDMDELDILECDIHSAKELLIKNNARVTEVVHQGLRLQLSPRSQSLVGLHEGLHPAFLLQWPGSSVSHLGWHQLQSPTVTHPEMPIAPGARQFRQGHHQC